MITSWINQENMLKALQEQMNNEMQKAAEPIIQQALKDVEIKMREIMAARLISTIEQSLSMERMGPDLHIKIHQAKPQTQQSKDPFPRF